MGSWEIMDKKLKVTFAQTVPDLFTTLNNWQELLLNPGNYFQLPNKGKQNYNPKTV